MKQLLLILLFSCSLAMAQEGDAVPDPIDVALSKAIEKNASTAGMCEAYGDAEEKWDKKLNVAYQGLKKAMKPQEWQELVTAQKAWVSYRDAQITSLENVYGNMEGTMWRPIHAASRMELTKNRAQFLDGLLRNMTMR